jgi:hypothetical protein
MLDHCLSVCQLGQRILETWLTAENVSQEENLHTLVM